MPSNTTSDTCSMSKRREKYLNSSLGSKLLGLTLIESRRQSAFGIGS